MNYKETITWLFSQLPMYQRVGKAAYKADLQTTKDLLNALKNPQEKFRAIHVAGTNGKGSVCHLLASILQEAGYKIGLYTSPHLKDFRERIKINGEMIPSEKVTAFVNANRETFTQIKPSFFEMTVAMAYDYFAEEQVDFAVLETGMGGRLDSTNVSHPIISVITNIGHDHQQFLGNELHQIAKEKAGIMKEDVPVVIGKKQSEIEGLFEKIAAKKNAELYFADEHFELRKIQIRDATTQLFDVWYNGALFLEKLTSPLLANYQAGNLATVFQAVQIMQDNGLVEIADEMLRSGIQQVFENTGLQGRWQTLSTNPLTICDTGHNPEGIQAVVEQIANTDFTHLHFVFGMVNDKNPEKILYLLPNQATYYFCKPDIPRGMEAAVLQQAAFKVGLRGQSFNSVTDALNSAVNNAGLNDLVFIGGSTFVVAEVL